MPPEVTLPALRVDAQTAAGFQDLLERIEGCDIGSPIEIPDVPVHLFLRWLAEDKGLLLHGSNDRTIEVFEPRAQTDAVQRATSAVFATADGIWPMFFAIVDRSRRHSLRNGMRIDATGVRHYNFAVDHLTFRERRFVTGVVYALPSDGFDRCRADDGTPTHEWLSGDPVVPLLRVTVRPADFPFLADIGEFDASDVFRVGDALIELERHGVVHEELNEVTIVVPAALFGTAADLVDALPALELADVTVTLETSADDVSLRLRGAPAFLNRLRRWARLPP